MNLTRKRNIFLMIKIYYLFKYLFVLKNQKVLGHMWRPKQNSLYTDPSKMCFEKPHVCWNTRLSQSARDQGLFEPCHVAPAGAPSRFRRSLVFFCRRTYPPTPCYFALQGQLGLPNLPGYSASTARWKLTTQQLYCSSTRPTTGSTSRDFWCSTRRRKVYVIEVLFQQNTQLI